MKVKETRENRSAEKVGVIMLDTNFPRIKGDIGNPSTFSFPVRYKVVKDATAKRVVEEQDPSLLRPFIEAAKELEREGVRAITTSCGFLSLFQKEIAAEITVPFYSSSLIQIPLVYAIAGKNGTLGVITANKAALTRRHFESVGAHDTPVAIVGMEEMPAFRESILHDGRNLDREAIAEEVVHQAKRLVKENPHITAIVMECTNLPPYRDNIKKELKLPVFDIVTLTNYVYESLC
jgi:Asp/Glu/hydantoin racemase